MQYIIVIVFIIAKIWFGNELGYTNLSPVYTHFTYMFQHANWLHLVFNSLAFIGVYRVLSKRYHYLLALVVFIGFGASFLVEYSIPTVGSSGMVYALFGMYFSMNVIGWKDVTEKKGVLKSALLVFLAFIVSVFSHNSSYMLHAICLVSGFTFTIIIEKKYDKFTKCSRS